MPPQSRTLIIDVDLPDVKDFRRDLARADTAMRRDFDASIRGAGAEVRDTARESYYDFYRRRSGQSPKGITSTASFGLVKVRLGDERRPHLLGQEWGGGTRESTQQFPPWGREGRFFWPTAVAAGADIERKTLDAMDDAVEILADRR